MLLTGTYTRTLDEKYRLAIPKRWRELLSEWVKRAFFVAPGTDGSLAIYTEQAFSRLAERLEKSSPTQQDVRAFSRLFYAQAQSVELDLQGRIRIPMELAKLAGLVREAVLLGVHDHMELWDRQRWEAYRNDKAPKYDQLAEVAFEPRPGGLTNGFESIH